MGQRLKRPARQTRTDAARAVARERQNAGQSKVRSIFAEGPSKGKGTEAVRAEKQRAKRRPSSAA